MASFVCEKHRIQKGGLHMSVSTLKLWSNTNLELLNQQVNIGDSWVIDPDGPIVEPTECVVANPTPGILKIYRNVHPNSLIIHWLYPNLHIGHILWVSKAPLRLTMAQVKTVRHIEDQLARNWERAMRWEFVMCTPPQFESHWDLEKYTRPVNLPTVPRGRDQETALTKASPATIEHYAKLLENRKHEFTDLNIDLEIDREAGLAYYNGYNGLRTYPLVKTGYQGVIRALGRARAYRRKHA